MPKQKTVQKIFREQAWTGWTPTKAVTEENAGWNQTVGDTVKNYVPGCYRDVTSTSLTKGMVRVRYKFYGHEFRRDLTTDELAAAEVSLRAALVAEGYNVDQISGGHEWWIYIVFPIVPKAN